MQTIGISWVDFAVLLLILIGMVRGRKRGMSQEILDIFKWAIIVVVAAFLYEPLGQMLAQFNLLGLTASYVFVYAAIGLIILAIFAYIRARIGDKLSNRDAFGAGEYYLGMVAGAFRYACIIIVVMAFLNARYYTQAEMQARAKAQIDALGSDFFPSLGDFQQEVFHRSAIGRFAKENMEVLLIRPVVTDAKGGSTAKPRR